MNLRSLYTIIFACMFVGTATMHAMEEKKEEKQEEKKKEIKILTGYGPFDARAQARMIQNNIVSGGQQFGSETAVFRAINRELDKHTVQESREIRQHLCAISAVSGSSASSNLWTAVAAFYADYQKRQEETAQRQELYGRLPSGERVPKLIRLEGDEGVRG